MKSRILVICMISAVFSLVANAATNYVWDGGPAGSGTDFNTAENWNPDGVPNGSLGDNVTISLDGADVTMSSPVVLRTITVSGTGAESPVLNITKDINKPYSPFYVGSHASGIGYSGVVNHTMGTVNIGGSGNMRLYIASSLTAGNASAGNSGFYYFGGEQATAPTLIVGNTANIAQRTGETGLLAMSGYGTFSTGSHMQIGIFFGSGAWSIEGGNLSINIGEDLRMHTYGGSAISTISAALGDNGFSTINVAGNVAFGTGSGINPVQFVLSIADGYVHEAGTVHKIIDAGGVFTGHKQFANVDDGDILNVGYMSFEANYVVSAADPNTYDQFTLTALPIDTSITFNRGSDLTGTAKTANYHGTLTEPGAKIWEYWVKPFAYDRLDYSPGELQALNWSATYSRFELIDPVVGWGDYHSVATFDHLNTFWRVEATGKQSWVVATFKNPYPNSVEFEISGVTQYKKTLLDSSIDIGVKLEIALINSNFTTKQTLWSYEPTFDRINVVYDIPDPALTGENSVTLKPGEYIALAIRGSRYTYRNNLWYDSGLNITATSTNFAIVDVQTSPEIVNSGITPGIDSYLVLKDEGMTLAAEDFAGACPTAYMFDHWEIDGLIYSYESQTTYTPTGDASIVAVYTQSNECGDVCRPYPMADATQDCVVDLDDFAILARDWMDCTDPSCD